MNDMTLTIRTSSGVDAVLVTELPRTASVGEAVFAAILMAGDGAKNVEVIGFDDGIGTPPGAKCFEMGVPGVTLWNSSVPRMPDSPGCEAVIENAVANAGSDGVVELLVRLPGLGRKYRLQYECEAHSDTPIRSMRYLSSGKWKDVSAALFSEQETAALVAHSVLSAWKKEDEAERAREMLPAVIDDVEEQYDTTYLNRYGEICGVPCLIVGYDKVSEKYLATDIRTLGNISARLYRVGKAVAERDFVPMAELVQKKTGRNIYVKTDEFDAKKDFPLLFCINGQKAKVVSGFDILAEQYISMDLLTGKESHVSEWDAASYVEPVALLPTSVTKTGDGNYVGRAFVSAPSGKDALFRVIAGQDAVTGNYLYASFSVGGGDSYKSYPGGGEAFAKKSIYDYHVYIVSDGWNDGMTEICVSIPPFEYRRNEAAHMRMPDVDAICDIMRVLHDSRYGDESAERGKALAVYATMSDSGRRRMAKFMKKFVKFYHNPLMAMLPMSLFDRLLDAAGDIMEERVDKVIEAEVDYSRLRLPIAYGALPCGELRFLQNVDVRQLKRMLGDEDGTLDIATKIFFILREINTKS